MTRREFVILTGAALGGTALACGRGGRLIDEPSGTDTQTESGPSAPAEAPTAAPLIRRQVITANDFAPEQMNSIETVLVAVRYSGLPERNFD